MEAIKVTFEVKSSFDLTPEEFAKELLDAEIKMNAASKLRFNLIEDGDIAKIFYNQK